MVDRGTLVDSRLKLRLGMEVLQDPGEKESLHLQASFQTRVKTMERLLDKWWQPGDDTAIPKPPAN